MILANVRGATVSMGSGVGGSVEVDGLVFLFFVILIFSAFLTKLGNGTSLLIWSCDHVDNFEEIHFL